MRRVDQHPCFLLAAKVPSLVSPYFPLTVFQSFFSSFFFFFDLCCILVCSYTSHTLECRVLTSTAFAICRLITESKHAFFSRDAFLVFHCFFYFIFLNNNNKSQTDGKYGTSDFVTHKSNSHRVKICRTG